METIVRVDDVDLRAESFGDRGDPAVRLIGGATASMLWWEDDFSERLAADAVGLLDAFGLEHAHVVGISMGGAIALLAALAHPDRVASLTLVATSPGGSDLPPMSAELAAVLREEGPATVDRAVELLHAHASCSRPFDADAAMALVRRDRERTTDVAASLTNHVALNGGGPPLRGRLAEIAVPALVLHGGEDPLFPLAHGAALARELPDARLLVLGQAGHELARADWDVAVRAILKHTKEAP